MMRINHLAVFIAAIAYFLLGGLWYAVLFAGMWSSLIAAWLAPVATANMKAGAGPYVVAFLTGLVLAYATAVALSRRPGDLNVKQGINFAVFIGISVYATQTLNNAVFEQKPIALWIIDTLYVLVGFIVIGVIVGAMPPKTART